MKLNVKYMIAAFALLGLVGCDKNFEEFETSGGGSPAAVELSTVVSEALPGQIKLTWKAPEGDYAYMQIRYYDPLQKNLNDISLICRFSFLSLFYRKKAVRWLLSVHRKC